MNKTLIFIIISLLISNFSLAANKELDLSGTIIVKEKMVFLSTEEGIEYRIMHEKYWREFLSKNGKKIEAKCTIGQSKQGQYIKEIIELKTSVKSETKKEPNSSINI